MCSKLTWIRKRNSGGSCEFDKKLRIQLKAEKIDKMSDYYVLKESSVPEAYKHRYDTTNIVHFLTKPACILRLNHTFPIKHKTSPNIHK
jgi:hypothetical protein